MPLKAGAEASCTHRFRRRCGAGAEWFTTNLHRRPKAVAKAGLKMEDIHLLGAERGLLPS